MIDHLTRRAIACALGVAALVLSAGGTAAAGPQSELQTLNLKLNGLAKQNASDASLKQAVNQLLDYDLLAQNTLRDHWSTRSAAELTEFKGLFRSLIEKNYIKGLRKNADYTVTYKREDLSGSEAKVATVVKGMRKGRMQESDVVYRMRRRDGRWVVYDVITDDVSMEQNYRNSFNRIIKDKGWSELLAKLRKKLQGG
jgi:phospholipid transport system substrate-binding protein